MKSFTSLALSLVLVSLTGGILRGQDQTVYTIGEGVTAPTVVKQVKPEYTKDGYQLGIQGSVLLSAVVLSDGTVGDVQVERSLDKETGLDQAAIDAMKQWLFKPGTKDDKPVAVRIRCEITFSLK